MRVPRARTDVHSGVLRYLTLPYIFILKVLRARLHARSIESRAKFSSSSRSPVNHSQQTVVKLLVPLMVTTMMPAPTHPLAPTARQMGHPHHSDVAIAAVQWF